MSALHLRVRLVSVGLCALLVVWGNSSVAAADEVTIKVDEASNTKLRITLASIARVVRETEGEETPAK